MKKVVFMLSLAAVSTIVFYSCKKDILSPKPLQEEEIITKSNESILEIDDDKFSAAFPIEIGIGRTAPLPGEKCGGNYKCGPCPGICIRIKRPRVVEGRGNNNSGDLISEVFPLKKDKIIGEQGVIDGEISIFENYLKVVFKEHGADEDNGLVSFPENIMVNKETSEKLGRQNIVIERGEYMIDYSNNQFGEVILKIIDSELVAGPPIRIALGRLPRNWDEEDSDKCDNHHWRCGPCTGICIGKTVIIWKQGVGSNNTENIFSVFPPHDGDNLESDEISGNIFLVDSGHIKIKFNGHGADDGDGYISFSENVLLDENTTKNLSLKSPTVIKKGRYKIDYSENVYGEVVLSI